MNNIIVAALYQFVNLQNIEQLQTKIKTFCDKKAIKGTLLLATEGINGTVAGTRDAIDALLFFLKAIPGFATIDHKESFATEMPFYRMKVKLKKEIVTMGVAGISPTKKVGHYVKAADWNALINDPDVILIDTRNDYEVDIGTFKGSIDPRTTNFREFPEYVKNNMDPAKHKKVAMFCTGGIRCEKASSYMIEQGFDEVYHLQGGILKYLETVPEDESLWTGECFVFDQRVAVGHGLAESDYDQCFACRHPLSPLEMQSPQYCVGISCIYCFNKLSIEKKISLAERQKQLALAEKRNEPHLGDAARQLLARKKNAD